MNSKTRMLVGIIVLLLIIAGGAFLYINNLRNEANRYKPQIKPADFTAEITNKYFALPVGKKMTYESTDQRGITERIEIEILSESKVIEGVETAIYLDRVYNNGQLVEETRDYLAQHKNGDVWYFGEDVNNFMNGILLNNSGSFIHGMNGAKAGIWMKAEQRVGDSYRQEYYVGNAEDMRDTVATGLTVSTKFGIHQLRQSLRLDAA